MMFRKLLTIWLVSLLVIVGMSLTLHAKTPVKMMMIYGESEEPAWQGMVDAFNAQSPDIEVELIRLVVGGGWDGYTQKMQAMIAAGDPPDIGRFTPTYTPGFAAAGLLVDLMPYVEAENFDLGQFYESALNTGMFNGHLYALPAGIYTQAMYYNKKLFDEAGVGYPDESWTEMDMINAAVKLTTGEGPDKVYGMYLDIALPERIFHWFWANGADLFNEGRTECALTEPAAIETLKLLQDIIWDYKVAPTPAEYGTSIWYERFISGKLAMVQEGAWMIPGFSQVLAEADWEWGVAPYPLGRAGRFTYVWADPYVVFKGAKQPEAAWQVLKFFATEGANVLIDHAVMGAPLSKIIAQERRSDLFNPLSDEEKQVWLGTLEYARNLDFPANWMEMKEGIVQGFDLLALNEATPEEVAEMISEEVNRLLAEL